MRLKAYNHSVAVCLSMLLPWWAAWAGDLGATAGQSGGGPAFDFEGALVAGESMPRLHSLLVSYRGDLVLEHYFNGYDSTRADNVKSVSKTILSALVGVALERGYIHGLGATLGQYFPRELSVPGETEKAGITLENLLTMQSGLDTTSNENYGAWVSSENWVAFALRQPLSSEPGTRMIYSTGNTHLLSAMLTQATGRSTLEFARAVLAEPLGFRLRSWPQDPQGIYFGGNDMELTPRHMLAFGELYLNGGRFGKRQVLPAWWVEASLQPRAESPVGASRYYGYGWWICALGGYEAPHAWGYGGQFIVLLPALELVVVTTSSSRPDPERSAHAARVYEWIQEDVIRAVAEAVSNGDAALRFAGTLR